MDYRLRTPIERNIWVRTFNGPEEISVKREGFSFFERIIAGVSAAGILVAILGSPAHAGGSMGQDVKIVIVRKSPTIYRLDAMREMEKRQRNDNKAAMKEQLNQAKETVKEMRQATKDYEKMVKARTKKFSGK